MCNTGIQCQVNRKNINWSWSLILNGEFFHNKLKPTDQFVWVTPGADDNSDDDDDIDVDDSDDDEDDDDDNVVACSAVR